MPLPVFPFVVVLVVLMLAGTLSLLVPSIVTEIRESQVREDSLSMLSRLHVCIVNETNL